MNKGFSFAEKTEVDLRMFSRAVSSGQSRRSRTGAIRAEELFPVEKCNGRQHCFATSVTSLAKLRGRDMNCLQLDPLGFTNRIELRLDLVGQIVEHGGIGEIAREFPFGWTSCEILTI